MKKIIIAIAIMLGGISFVQAQAPANITKETKKQKKEKTTSAQTTTVQNKGLKKDGTPDMRLKANKTKAQTVPVQPATTVQTQTITKTKRNNTQPSQPQVQHTQVTSTTTKSADKVIETDAKGRTIYQGPKGGKYYINKNGHKEYIK